MMCYPPSGYVIFSLRKLKFCGSRGLGAEGQIWELGAWGQGSDNPKTLGITKALIILWLRNLYALTNCFFLKFSSNCLWWFLSQHKHFYSIKASLKFACLRKHSQFLCLIPHVFLSLCRYLHFILWISSIGLLTRFDNELSINLALSINCNL